MKKNQHLKYLVGVGNKLRLDTRFIRCDPTVPGRISQGGLFSLDGIHPTTIGYSLIADLLVQQMKKVGVSFPAGAELPWEEIIKMDTLVNDPPGMLENLRSTLAFLDGRELLSALLELFS